MIYLALITYFLYFITYSFLGWVYESTLCSITGKKLVNRGFLNGPICPVYGFGALLIVLVFYGRNPGILPLFLSSMVLTSVVEYFTAVLLEKLFHARWWDYSGRPFNIHGRVYLTGALVFAVLSVLIIRWIHPVAESFISTITPSVQVTIAGILFLLVALDLFITVRHLLLLHTRISAVRDEFDRLIREGEVKLDELKHLLQNKLEGTVLYTDRVKALFQKGRFQNRRIFNAFPNLTALKNNEIFSKLKSSFLENKKKLDDKIRNFNSHS